MARMVKEEIASRNPNVVSGALVFTGTRVPVKNLVDYLEMTLQAAEGSPGGARAC